MKKSKYITSFAIISVVFLLAYLYLWNNIGRVSLSLIEHIFEYATLITVLIVGFSLSHWCVKDCEKLLTPSIAMIIQAAIGFALFFIEMMIFSAYFPDEFAQEAHPIICFMLGLVGFFGLLLMVVSAFFLITIAVTFLMRLLKRKISANK